MKNNYTRRYRFRSNSRGYRRNGANEHSHKVSNFGSITQNHGYYNRNNQNASKMFEKYTNLAKEALSSGDKVLSENYFQHADHFSRIVSSKSTNNEKKEEDQNSTHEQKDPVVSIKK